MVDRASANERRAAVALHVLAHHLRWVVAVVTSRIDLALGVCGNQIELARHHGVGKQTSRPIYQIGGIRSFLAAGPGDR